MTSVVPDWAAFWDREWQAVDERPTRSIVWLDGLLLALVLVITVATGTARGADDAADLYAARCAVCHGADRGGYIAPALSPTSLKRFTEAQLRFKIMTGGVRTLMPAHPSWGDRLAKNEIARLAALIKNAPLEAMSWDLEDISASLTVDVADEDALPRKPSYPIDDMDDLMAVMARGHYAAGEASKVVFFNGATNEQIGEVATFQAPHLADFHPRDERWMYLTTDGGYVFKIDLYSMQAVRRVRVALNGASLAISRDGRYLAAGSFVPNTAVILDSGTLEPLKLLELRGVDPDGNVVESDSGVILGTPYADYFVIALEQSGQVWIVDLGQPDFPVTRIEQVGRHLHDAFLSESGRYVAMASYDDDVIAVIDLESRKVIKRLPAGRQPHVGSGAVVKVGGRTLGIGTNIGVDPYREPVVTVFDMDTFEVVKQIPVLGPTESPAAHPDAPYIVVDIVGTGPTASKIQFIDKESLEVVETLDVGGHSHFPEYTAKGDYLYVSAGYHGNALVIYDSRTLDRIKTFPMEVPAGIFSHARARTVAIGLE